MTTAIFDLQDLHQQIDDRVSRIKRLKDELEILEEMWSFKIDQTFQQLQIMHSYIIVSNQPGKVVTNHHNDDDDDGLLASSSNASFGDRSYRYIGDFCGCGYGCGYGYGEESLAGVSSKHRRQLLIRMIKAKMAYFTFNIHTPTKKIYCKIPFDDQCIIYPLSARYIIAWALKHLLSRLNSDIIIDAISPMLSKGLCS
jgi:hypothetical protein